MGSSGQYSVENLPPGEPANSRDSTSDSAYESERRETVLRQIPAAVGVLLGFSLTWGTIEWFQRPAHRLALVLFNGLLFVVCTAAIGFSRRFPVHAVSIATLGVNASITCLLLYTALVGGSGELNVIALTLLLGGVVAILPLGPRHQLLASVAAIFGYPLILLVGARTHLDPWYSLTALLAAVCVTTLGSATIDRYRRRILEQSEINARLVHEANAAHAAKTEFLSTVAHELRNPLGAVIGYTDLLRDGAFPDPSETDDTLKRIHGQAVGMLDMLQNLLDIDKIEAGGVRLDVSEFDVARFLEELRANLPPSWEKPGVEIRWNLPPSELRLTSDRRKLAAILRNLIHNAIKYTEQGTVRIAAHPRGEGFVEFRVEDTGEGIPTVDLPHIFDRFRQSRNPSRAGGVGLGLHIVKRFGDALDASIDVESVVGDGTVFSLTLPTQGRNGQSADHPAPN